MKARKVANKRRVWVGTVCIALLPTVAIPAWAQLDDECSVTVNGQTVDVSAGGTFRVSNVAAGQELLRVHTICESEGITLYGVSEFFSIQDSQTYNVQNIAQSPTPLPTTVSVTAAPDDPTLTIGETTQVNVTALQADGAEVDVTPRATGTTYTSSNNAVATVDLEGLVEAVGLGIAFITASNEGATAVTSVAVTTGADPLTTVEGFVLLDDGMPADGAIVTVLGLVLSDATGSDGFFSIPGVPSDLGPIGVLAEINLGGGEITKVVALSQEPIPNGFTDMGILTPVATKVLWAIGISGNWLTGSNWHTGSIPGPLDTAIIATPGDYTVTLNTSPTLASFIMSAPQGLLTSNGRTMTVNGPVSILDGTVLWRSSSWNGVGPLTNEAEIIIELFSTVAIPFEQNGDLRIEPSGINATLNATSGLINRGTLILESVSGTAIARLNVTGGPLTNEGLIELRPGTGGSPKLTGDLINNGSVTISTLTTATGNTTYTNNGEFGITAAGTLRMSGASHVFTQNAGTLTVSGLLDVFGSASFNFNGGSTVGEVTIRGTALNIGPAAPTDIASFSIQEFGNTLSGNITAGVTVAINSVNTHTTLTTSGNLTNFGTLVLEVLSGNSNPRLFVSGGTLTNEGVIETRPGTGGAPQFTGDLLNNGRVTISTLSTTLGATTYTNNGDFDITAGGTLRIDGTGQIFNQNAGTLTVSGLLDVSGFAIFNFNGGSTVGAVTIRGTVLNIGPAAPTDIATFSIQESGNTLTGDITAGVTVAINGASLSALLKTTGDLTNFGALILEAISGNANSRLFVDGGTFTNEGVIEARPGTGGAPQFTGDLLNNGRVTISTLSTTLGATTYTNNGDFDITAGGTLRISSFVQVFSQDAGTLTVSGLLDVISGAIFNFNGGSTVGTVTLRGGVLNIGPAAPTDMASFSIQEFGNTLSGDITAGVTVAINSTNIDAILTASGDMTNFGTLVLEAISGNDNPRLNVSGGTLTNEGVIEAKPGTGGTPRITGNVINNGTVNLGTGAATRLQLDNDYTQTASGELNLDIGGLTVGTEFDQLAVLNNVDLAGALNISIINGFTPILGDTFEVLTFGSRIGEFTSVHGLDAGGGLIFELNYGPTELTLVVIAP